MLPWARNQKNEVVMFSCQIDDAIVGIAKAAFLNANRNFEDGVYVRARVFVRTNPYAERDASRFLHFVFRRIGPDGSSVNVWFQLGGETGFIPDDAEWQNTSNHDSCWRSDGVRSPIVKAYFDLCSEVAPKKAPVEMVSTAHIDHVAIVKIQVKPTGGQLPLIIKWRGLKERDANSDQQDQTID